MMRLGIFAKTFPGSDSATVLAAARAAGYDGVHYNMACSGLAALPEVVPAGTAEAIGSAARASGIVVEGISATYNMIHPDPALRRRGHAALAAIAGVAAAIGAPLLTLCTGTRDPLDQWRHHPDNATPEAWRDLCESLECVLPSAEALAVDLGIEPELANVIDSAALARRLIDTMGSSRLKIIFDPANLFEVESPARRRDIVAEAIDLLADRIVMAHAKDRTADGGFTRAGTGVVDWDFFLRRLESVGFDGPLVTHGLLASEAPSVAIFLRGRLAAREAIS